MLGIMSISALSGFTLVIMTDIILADLFHSFILNARPVVMKI